MEPKFKILRGSPEPLGLSHSLGVTNFAIWSLHAPSAELCLFWKGGRAPDARIPLEGPYLGIWYVALEGLPKGVSYAYRFGDDETLLSDPYALAYSNHYAWGDFSKQRIPFLCSADPIEHFDWQGVDKPQIPLEKLVIYEMHLRGFTCDPSSHVQAPGTFVGAIEKIPYLKKLGINAIELMPIHAFDETHCKMVHPKTGQRLVNYWGYSPLSFFIPMCRYAKRPEMAAEEFKKFVREMHRAGIEVILDVVYNHTTEDPEYISSWRGIDKSSYYMIDETGADRNYSGCGNTFQTNSPAGMRLILDSLRYWSQEMQVDGFRFDLASILTRGLSGKPLLDPPLMKTIAKDPILKGVKLIAEPWDAAGLYQVGQFPNWGSWSAWNGLYRDHVRRFIKGTDHEAGAFATAISGSEPSYGPAHTPLSSVNFITAHDGFSLQDLVSYQEKHNQDNGENNRDGSNANDSWNCGIEGPTQDSAILSLRERQMRNFWVALFLSQGIPMFHMGDEIGHTRFGNNNPYVQDNRINWFHWDELAKHADQLQFVSSLIAFRKNHEILQRKEFLKPADIDWHGHAPHHPDWNPASRFVAYTLKDAKHSIYVAFNAHFEEASISLPVAPDNKVWKQIVNTAFAWKNHALQTPEKGETIPRQIKMLSYSALLAIAI